MDFSPPLIEARFVRRYKRFFADIELNNKIEVAHVPNTGSLKGCLLEGAPCLVSPSDNPERKLKYTLEALSVGKTWVGVNTGWPNKLIKEAFTKGVFSHWRNFEHLQTEVKLNKETRLDACLSKGDYKHFVEVKNVTLADAGVAMFPDAVTERGQKHLRELTHLVQQGHSAEILFAVQRTDCEIFKPAADIDPEYAELLVKALKAGVKVTAAEIKIDNSEVGFTGRLLRLIL